MEQKNKIIKIIFISILILQVFARIYVANKKEYFHMDEAYSYGLMNYPRLNITDSPDFNNQWHSGKYFEDYLSINQEEVLNLKPVYENQKNDVHPPFYYFLLRIVATFSINSFSKWTGITLNIICFIISSIFLYKLSEKILHSSILGIVTIFINGFTIASLENTIYIRMYELSTLTIILITYTHFICLEKENLSKKDLFLIALPVFLGVMTHYYSAIYIAIIAIIFILKVLKQKQYKKAVQYIGTMLITAIIFLCIFPYAISHVFFGYRGQGALTKILPIKEFLSSLCQYLFILSKILFNGLTIILIIPLIYYFIKNKNRNKVNNILIIILPTIAYFLLVVKAAPYKELRYVLPICPMIILCCVVAIHKVAQNYQEIFVCLLACNVILISPKFTNTKLEFTYSKYNHIVEKVEGYQLPAIYIFDSSNNRFLDDIYLFSKIKETYILPINEVSKEHLKEILMQKETREGIILFCSEHADNYDIIKQIKEIMEYKEDIHLQRMNAGDVYILR